MTMQGVVRTHYLERMGVDWNAYRVGAVDPEIMEAVGLPEQDNRPATFGNLRVSGPLVARLNANGTVECLIKAPLDLLYNKDKQVYRLLRPEPREFETNVPFDAWQPLMGGGEKFKGAEGWLTERQFNSYLDGQIGAIGQLVQTDEVFQLENRVGLALDYTRRANRESMFYHAEFVRPCERVGLLFHVNFEIFEGQSGTLGIGGESRTGHYEITNEPTLFQKSHTGRIRIILLTPGYFREGWQPREQNWSPWVGNGRLVSAVVGKPQLISGWDLAHNRPKPLHHFVPAGSVFFFEGADQPGIPFTETPSDSPDYGAMGFGTFTIGTW